MVDKTAKGMKIWFAIRSALFVIAGSLILAFYNLPEMALVIPYTVGITIGYYGIESLILALLKKSMFEKEGNIIEGVVFITFSVLMMFVINNEIAKVCVLWAMWVIERELREAESAVKSLIKGGLGILNILESATLIVFSILLMVDSEEHMITHMFLLGLELILEVAFVCMNLIFLRFIAPRLFKNKLAVTESLSESRGDEVDLEALEEDIK